MTASRNGLALSVVTAVLCSSFAVRPAIACTGLRNLKEVVNGADQTRQRNGPRAAIRLCYKPYEETPLFSTGEPHFQNRFLYEYVDAALVDLNYDLAADVAERYVLWYLTLPREVRVGQERTFPTRPATMLFHYLTALEHLKQPDRLLAAVEQVHEDPVFFSPRVLNTWERYLKLVPARFEAREVLPAEIRALARQDPVYRGRWSTYRKCLDALERVPRFRNDARHRIQLVIALRVSA